VRKKKAWNLWSHMFDFPSHRAIIVVVVVPVAAEKKEASSSTKDKGSFLGFPATPFSSGCKYVSYLKNPEPVVSKSLGMRICCSTKKKKSFNMPGKRV
jgi:hypothetical protein